MVQRASATDAAPPPVVEDSLNSSFQGAVPASQLLSSLSQALSQHGFTGENTIAVTATCRDEICRPLVREVESMYGHAFEITGLGGLLTCGVTGMKAGLSHAPTEGTGGRSKYLFFALPHVGVETDGTVGKVRRPGMGDPSGACGALIAALGELQGGSVDSLVLPENEYTPDDPEYSILKSRLAKRLQKEGVSDSDVKGWKLPDLTKAAERMITADLEYLISKAVDTSSVDYAVVTGVQVHATTAEKVSADLNELIDYIYPAANYVVVNGQKRDMHLSNGAA